MTASFDSITFTVDPIATSLKKDAKDAADLGLIPSADVLGIYDLSILNRILKAGGKPTYTGA